MFFKLLLIFFIFFFIIFSISFVTDELKTITESSVTNFLYMFVLLSAHLL
jgi:hypothetical protein